MTDSPAQSRIYDWIENGSGSAVIRSAAGSGKSTTLRGVCKRIPMSDSAILLAFNKDIADDMDGKLPYYVQCKTFHSHFRSEVDRALTRPRLDKNKTKWLFKDSVNDRDFWNYMQFVLRLVSFAKNSGYRVLDDGPASLMELVEQHDMFVERGDIETGCGFAEDVYQASLEDTNRIDFDDMLLFPLAKPMSLQRFNYVLVDEGQDTNSVQRALLHKILAPNGRLIVAADPNQAIYGFRGADADAYASLVAEFACAEFALDVSYRCSQAVVAEAQRVLQRTF